MRESKKRVIYTALATLIVVFSTTFAILMTLERTDYRNYLQAQYSKNMYELINSVQNIRVNLSKSSIVGSKEQNIIVFDQIFRYASMANDKLHSLPVGQDTIEDTSKFLSQVGDFCYTLGKTVSEGSRLQEKDYKTIDDLKKRSYQLELSLNQIGDEINEGRVKWGEIRKRVSGVLAKNKQMQLSEKFENIQKQVLQYPALIYDGPFSDNVVKIQPRVNSQRVVSVLDAEKKVKEVVGKNRIQSINKIEKNANTRIPTYSFDVFIKGRKDKNSKIACEVSKYGGKVVYLIDNKPMGSATITKGDAIKRGKKYLENVGYKDMVPTYSQSYGNSVVVNYVYKKDNIMIYPDQIKLKIALDDGNIIGIESEKYLVSHTDNRDIKGPKISLDEAKQKVGNRLKIHSARLAVVPTETDKEVLCYEFIGSYNNENFIVYINANTGFEQRIIQIINTPNGQLTM